MDAKDKFLRISFEGTTFAIGGKWVSDTPKFTLLPSFWGAKEAKKFSLPYGVIAVSRKAKSTEKTVFQCALSNSIEAGIIHGSIAVSQSVINWPGYDRSKTSVLVLPVNMEDGQSAYWITAVSSNGIVIGEYERIHSSLYDVLNTISEIELTEQPNYFYVENDISSETIFEQHKERSNLDLHVSTVSERLLKTALENKKSAAKQLYKKSNLELKKAGVAIAASFIIASAYGVYSYIDTAESSAWLSDQANADWLASKKSKLQKEIEGFKSSKNWTALNYKDTVIEQFVENLPTGMTAPEIAISIKHIERILPLYAADWTMTKISYINGDFFAFYQRDKMGKGVFFHLDKVISLLNTQQKEISIEGHSLLNNAEVRLYKISQNSVISRGQEKSEMLNRFHNEKKLQMDLTKIVQKMNNDIVASESYIADFAMLTFKEKWIEKKGKRLFIDAKEKYDAVVDFEGRFIEAKRRLVEAKKPEIKDEWILGSVLDFVTLMQTDSLFTWTYPAMTRTFPDAKTIKERTPKKKKNKNKKTNVNDSNDFLHAIETYTVEVSTQESEGDGKVKSYGVLDMLQLALLIDKPYITVDVVEYDPMTEQWKLALMFNRKTPEFNKRML